MKLIRFGQDGNEKPGLWKDNRIVDLKKIYPEIPDFDEEFFEKGWLEKIKLITDAGERMDVRIGCPVCRPSKIICLGKNYSEHAKEGGFENPERPLLFCKTPNTLNGPYDPIVLPKSSVQVDWEVELAVIIGKKGKRIKKKDAFSHIAGFTILNDVSGRDAQFSDSQWFRGKSFDSFAPVGPCVVTPDEIDDVQNLPLTTTVNGNVMQDGNTKDMIFDIPTIIEYISEDIALLPGDILSTGTPSGVGIFRDPPVVLKPGDVVECRIEGIGSIKNEVIER
ncbi:MAG: fumarylacetoacetate hydrolase family protein [Desulfobacterales bacterium]|jgi:2-keto-4-pentenoate hydratase/2-oxohepta-3-ene-1,7-dioic acid hydratase in catechol pathway|nr:fumarylacetoacetate hydrolase family protein [Desulfobacterales bacterium]MDP6683844.1 fumarylacetoacetate hydrolase family protein [Desulfobacterales bacterium]MDP6808945.1 fumarylacetoacetate hydrolase family protein [Desulfobacterales bacterium]|tara:strand:- start:72 stop:908 length:837 start_codon:yes stop_codon:yes gene_type:complete